MISAWEQRKQKKRAKVPAREVFYDGLNGFHPLTLRPDAWFHSQTPSVVHGFIRQTWLGKHFSREHTTGFSTAEREGLWKTIQSKLYTKRLCYTDSWGRPPGINVILLNDAVSQYYRFCCGSHIFPIRFIRGVDTCFFSLQRIPDGSILNPPFSEPLLDKIIRKLIFMANDLKLIYAVILPYKITKDWFRVLEAFKVPVLLLKNPIAYLRGIGEKFVGISPFQSCIVLIGAVTYGPHIEVDNDPLGFPTNLKYVEEFNHIHFPQNLDAMHGTVQTKGFNDQMNLLHTIFDFAAGIDNTLNESDVTDSFDFQTLKVYNNLLQNVEDEIESLNSHLWAHNLNPWIESRAIWDTIHDNDRRFVSRKEMNKFLNNCFIEPRNAHKNHQCKICKGRGHLERMCPSRVPTISDLGLGSLIEKKLYQYIRKAYSEGRRPQRLVDIDLTDPFTFWTQTKAILHREAQFWVGWSQFAKSKGIENPNIVFNDEEFSKGRKALGFNFAMGAPLSELMLDAFGAILHLVNPPEPCEIVERMGDDGIPIYPKLDPQILQEDEVELKRRTQYIVPKKYIKYILPRFVVVNNDKTQRSINDCRLLGPFTPRSRFRLDTPQTLRNFAPDDIILSIDGKSAYKQRKLCWASRSKIGFRTIIDKKVCYVALATPPFGLHNAGHIYQKNLEAKLHRVSGGLFWIEYIDDVVIRLGSKSLNKAQLQWVGSAFLWLLTKCGEIMNNKFHVFQHVVTMLGMKYNLDTDRFIPKLDSLYKLGTLLSQILKKPQISVGEIEKLCGRVNWICGPRAREALKPLYQFIGATKRTIDPLNKLPHSRIQSTRKDWNIRIHQSIIDILGLVVEQFKQFRTPNIESSKTTLYIIVDTNPTVAGGYLIMHNSTSEFMKLDAVSDPAVIRIHDLSVQYLQKYGYDKLLHSHKNESAGLLRFLKQKYSKIKRYSKNIGQIIVVGDNLGLISNLFRESNKDFLYSTEHREIHSILRSFGRPYHFTWLRRSTSIVSFADQLGRLHSFRIKPVLFERLQNKWGELYTPSLLEDVFTIPRLLPKFILDKALDPNRGTPLVLIPFQTEVKQVIQTISTLCRFERGFVVGAPKVKFRSWRHMVQANDIFKVKNITSDYFLSPGLSNKQTTNMPYLFFRLRTEYAPALRVG